MRFETILFDLDGTLSESGPGITKAAQYALGKMGIDEPDTSRLTFFVGPPLNLTFRDHYGMNSEQTMQAIHYFQELYNRSGVFDTTLYSGIQDMLRVLKKSGHVLAVASSKPDPLVKQVLRHLEIDSFFDVAVGSDPSDEQENKAGADNKAQMVRKTLNEIKRHYSSIMQKFGTDRLSNNNTGNTISQSFLLSRTAMVGDRSFDMNGAKANHIAAIGVTYGYGTKEELKEAGADYIVDTVEDLKDLLLK